MISNGSESKVEWKNLAELGFFFQKQEERGKGCFKTMTSMFGMCTPHLHQPVFRSTWGSAINPGKKHSIANQKKRNGCED